MGYINGLLSGFLDAKQAHEDQQLKLAQDRNATEGKVYEALLGSPDPKVRNLAAAGLLWSAHGPQAKKGIAGWLGAQQTNPYLPQIEALNEQYGTEIGTPPPAVGGAAQPATSPTTGGPTTPLDTTSAAMAAALPHPAAPTPAPATIAAAPPAAHELFQSPSEAILTQQTAQQQGAIEGEINGLTNAFSRTMPPDQAEKAATEAVLAKYRRVPASALESVAGELPDGTPAFGVFDRIPGSPTYGMYIDPDSHEPLAGFRPRTSTGSTSLGADRETLARIMFGKPAAQLRGEELATVENARTLSRNQMTFNQALTHAGTLLPNGTKQQQVDLANALVAGTSSSPVPQTVGAPPPGSAAPAGTANPTPATAGAAPGAGPGTGTGTPTAAAVGTPPPGTAGVQLPTEMGGMTKQTGAPLPASVQVALAKAESTNTLIDQALQALEPYKTDNTLEGSINLARSYRQGVYDPVATAAAQLSDLAGLQSSAQAQLTGGASRALRFYIDRRQHVPRLPSARQILSSNVIGPGATQTVSQLLSSEGGFDSPQLMYQKLLGARRNNQNFIDALQASTTDTVPTKGKAGKGSATTSGYQMDDAGNLYKDGQLIAPAAGVH